MVKCSTCCFSIFLCGCNQLKSFHLTMANVRHILKYYSHKQDFISFLSEFSYSSCTLKEYTVSE